MPEAMISKSLDETKQLARGYLASLALERERAIVLGLSGELGSGKTAFTQAIARELGVLENITSPTFVLEKVYRLSGQKFAKLVHIDAYRIEQPVEMLTLGLPELLLRPKTLICIEWPEKISELLSPEHWRIEFRHGQNENERIIKLPW